MSSQPQEPDEHAEQHGEQHADKVVDELDQPRPVAPAAGVEQEPGHARGATASERASAQTAAELSGR
ncbi:MAG TPA: hypothetical protein VE781_01320 [Kineosporiaceae bacterium]|jgi:hypothetical protein|nr:hypothetical protein [Kineosporiaceae bacterium]